MASELIKALIKKEDITKYLHQVNSTDTNGKTPLMNTVLLKLFRNC